MSAATEWGTSRAQPRRESTPRVVVVTQVAESLTEDLNRRRRNYVLAMGLRTACFVAMLLLPGWWRLVALIGAAVLPVVAVIAANAVDHRRPAPLADEDQSQVLAISPGEIIKGQVVDTDEPPHTATEREGMP